MPGLLGPKGAPVHVPELHGDFSLNVANTLSADLLLRPHGSTGSGSGSGLSRIAPTHDLSAPQVQATAERPCVRACVFARLCACVHMRMCMSVHACVFGHVCTCAYASFCVRVHRAPAHASEGALVYVVCVCVLIVCVCSVHSAHLGP